MLDEGLRAGSAGVSVWEPDEEALALGRRSDVRLAGGVLVLGGVGWVVDGPWGSMFDGMARLEVGWAAGWCAGSGEDGEGFACCVLFPEAIFDPGICGLDVGCLDVVDLISAFVCRGIVVGSDAMLSIHCHLHGLYHFHLGNHLATNRLHRITLNDAYANVSQVALYMLRRANIPMLTEG